MSDCIDGSGNSGGDDGDGACGNDADCDSSTDDNNGDSGCKDDLAKVRDESGSRGWCYNCPHHCFAPSERWSSAMAHALPR